MTTKERNELIEWIIKARNYAAQVTRLTGDSKRAMKDVDKAEARLIELDNQENRHDAVMAVEENNGR